MSAGAEVLFGYDFYYLWSAGKIAAAGGNPYDLTVFQTQLMQIGWPQSEAVQCITHLPFIFWLYIPFSYLPFYAARWVWEALLAASFTALIVLARKSSFMQPIVGKQLDANTYFFASISFPPMWGNLAFGQVNIIALAALFASISFMRRGKPFHCGAALAWTFLKPHLLVPMYLALGVYHLRLRKWLFFPGLIVGLSIQILVTWLLAPSIFSYYLSSMRGIIQDSMTIAGSSLGQAGAAYFGLTWVRPVLFGLGCLTGILWGLRRVALNSTLILVVLPASIVCAPYVWSHSFVLLYPSYLSFVEALSRRIGRWAKYLVALFSVAGIGIIYRADLGAAWIVVPIGLLCFGLCALRTGGNNQADLTFQ